MHTKQHTIKSPITISGTGLHTGVKVNLTFRPDDIDSGIRFKRIDLPDQPIIEADADLVTDISRGTTLSKGEAKVSTVEHVLAALVGLQIDNVMIELDAAETPIMDGSSILFIEALEEVGLQEQNALRNFFEVPEGIFYYDDAKNVEMAALPVDDYRVTVMIDYNSKVLGSQHASLNNITDFKRDIASSRTFCFLHELQYLYNNNLVRGGDLNNAIVVVDKLIEPKELDELAVLFNKPKIEVKEEGILNNIDLRHKNEPARHKLLDVVGDLALVGRPIKAQILAARPGHSTNVEFAKKIKKVIKQTEKAAPKYNPLEAPVMDIEGISSMLMHRYPFQLVDKIIHQDHKTVIGIKNVTINENFFQGHFPNNPVMPGVLQIEAMAQTGGILVLSTVENPSNYWTYFLGIDNCKFRRMVKPGDTMVLKCELMAPIKRGIAKMIGTAYVGNHIVSEATLTARIVKKEEV
ncbi:bifunctional UDP-3-O-[3-hydroxymyristoyl] N-acetylglucosamine deacetylase/3-hydroxyacyl-ACP dehydratase [Marivirga atlantica]|jgi:UDP-3-O-[3-hydroxymyristoyl] N-acetylglucosamine deacetylase/3-hydroxyacyl-[acyl-carrier-protein] dehydratase|uniref:Multifunctional fusion protein n=1 Tax=Marivirga atlantica TaxID=1548457 RepID=A0A937DHW2_9BACT|nr:bifunctional UDP-3-O-[3-hydroxymyristoyl] N-acetylglucosamine deacetylase/3-hydroxyacyl-ACP dehydratase [Marivirga atlantica]MBL0766353.1 bifunctional UDP-3-O-[3-hydroxymyristoyl] N-acetylglucosamine deacetylase/3-hydroxyacyl-ACP dehydratase [Marivirga atlantica]